MNLEPIREYVRATVTDDFRFSHILSVETECVRLSELFSLSKADADSLRLAGLLHDITKGKKSAEQRELYRRFGLTFGETERLSPKTLHAVTGAYLARELFPELVNDTVFHCILSHTTGAPNMSLPEKLLYLADFIEPTRTFPSCVSLRNAFYSIPEGRNLIEHLNFILLISFDMTLADLVEAHAYIHPTTIEARNYLLAHP